MSDTRETSVDPLLQPLQVGALTLKNRIYSTGHAPAGYLEDGRPGLRYELYHEEKAKGGLALTIIGGSSNVAPDSASVFDQIDAGNDAVLPFYESIAARVHRHDCAIMIQLTHLGRRSQSDIDRWLPAVAPSAVRERAHRSYPKVLEAAEIERIIGDYAAAAARAQRGGLDGIEVAAMAGHLIDQFLSPRTNHRTDEWGGPLQNRMRFGLRVLEAIREAVGSGFVVGLRVAGDEGVPDGLHAQDCVEIAGEFAASGLIDFLSVVYGSGDSDRELAEMIPVFGRPLGGRLPVARAIREAVGIPVFHAGRIADVETARYAVREGLVDMAGMTRAHIADPYVVAKLAAGEADRIRPCVGATYCASRAETFCLHNPATGREQTIPHHAPPAPQPRRVVVGGGPGGLEAARAAAERGHDVTLFEAGDRPGGQLLLAGRGTRHSEKLGIVGWLSEEARRLGVRIRLRTLCSADDVLACEPDAVIVANGGVPATPDVPGGELVRSTWDVLGRTPTPDRDVLVYDERGAEQALTAAEWLGTHGNRVHLVTPDRLVGTEVTGTVYPDYLRVLYEHDAQLLADHELVDVRRDGHRYEVRLANVFDDKVRVLAVDEVVAEVGTEPVTDLYDELAPHSRNGGATVTSLMTGTATGDEAAGFDLYRIGDAVASRNIHAALYDARRIALAL